MGAFDMVNLDKFWVNYVHNLSHIIYVLMNNGIHYFMIAVNGVK